MAKNVIVTVPTIKKPIQPSPGFDKKQLSDHKLDIMGLCGFGCTYCSSNSGNYLRINREPFADLTEQQLGRLPRPGPGPDFRLAGRHPAPRAPARGQAEDLGGGAHARLFHADRSLLARAARGRHD